MKERIGKVKEEKEVESSGKEKEKKEEKPGKEKAKKESLERVEKESSPAERQAALQAKEKEDGCQQACQLGKEEAAMEREKQVPRFLTVTAIGVGSMDTDNEIAEWCWKLKNKEKINGKKCHRKSGGKK